MRPEARRYAPTELLGAREARQRRDRLREQGVLPVRCRGHLRPVGDHHPDVGQRVADGAELPVEYGPHGPVSADERVAEVVVAVHECLLALVRQSCLEKLCELVDQRELAGLRRVPLAGASGAAAVRRAIRGRRRSLRPMASTSSACNAASVLAISSPDRPARIRVEGLGDRDGREDEPVDVLHHEERRAADVVVRAEGKRPRHAGTRLRERGQTPCARAPCRGRRPGSLPAADGGARPRTRPSRRACT